MTAYPPRHTAKPLPRHKKQKKIHRDKHNTVMKIPVFPVPIFTMRHISLSCLYSISPREKKPKRRKKPLTAKKKLTSCEKRCSTRMDGEDRKLEWCWIMLKRQFTPHLLLPRHLRQGRLHSTSWGYHL